ncbi:MAG: CDP-archaeol synthase [Lachnospiraceae bacterium]|nr:CDP-archaeol synthase [Lachnospiraceae bacterium]
MSTALKRVISGAVILILTIILGIVGGPVLGVALCVISCIGYIEFTNATKVREEGHRFNVFQVFGLLTIVAYYLSILAQDDWYCPQEVKDWLAKPVGAFNIFAVIIMLVFITGFIGILYAYIFSFPKFNFTQVSNAVFGVVYVALTLSFIYYIRSLPGGIFLVWMPFISAWFSDTCAYVVGINFGKHKMTPRLSPKKTYEGAAGGVLGGTLGSMLLGLIYVLVHKSGAISILSFGCMGFVGAIASMCGDLAASAIKRNNGVKDYGHIIPGHGGILDRFDSVIFTAPMVYFLMALLLQFAPKVQQ